MIKLSPKGFSIVEVLLTVVVFGLVGGTGYYVFQAKNRADTAKPLSEPSKVVEQDNSKPSNYNLAVEVVATTTDDHGKSQPFSGWLISQAALTCPMVSTAEGREQSLPKWFLNPKGWCDKSALGLPAETDKDGHITLYFSVEPSPANAEVGLYPGLLKAPQLNIKLPNRESRSLDAEILSADKWRVTLSL